MSNFVTKILPFLPGSIQFEELAEAASMFNRFSERLSTVKSIHEERLLVRNEWEQATRSLLACKEVDGPLIYDHMSTIIYLSMINHWALTNSNFDAVPWIGNLLHSASLKSRKLGCLAALNMKSLPRAYEGEEEDSSLLLANSISKMFSVSSKETIEIALKLATQHSSPSSWSLFSQGILRSLRSRHGSVRKYAWLALARLSDFDPHLVVSTLEDFWDQVVMQEADVDVICSMCTFFSSLRCEKPITTRIEEWLLRIQEALLKKPSAFLQCRILRLSRLLDTVNIDALLSIMKVHFEDGQDLVHFELLKSLPVFSGDSEFEAFVSIPMSYLKNEETTHCGLSLLELLVKKSVKAILRYQEHLLAALESDDPQIRLLALKVLRHAANGENWKLLLENCRKAIQICKPDESHTILKVLLIGIDFISRHELQESVFASIMEFLDEMPESLGEEHISDLKQHLKVHDSWSNAFITSAYLFEQEHSLLHHLFIIDFLSTSSHKNCINLLTGFLEKFIRDPALTERILISLAWQCSRGNILPEKTLHIIEDIGRNFPLGNVKWLVTCLLAKDPKLLDQFRDHHGVIDELALHNEPPFDELQRQFSKLTEAKVRVEKHHAENDGLPSFPSIVNLPQFPTDESAESPDGYDPAVPLKITSDLFKGLLL